MFGSAFWRKGYATEAVQAVLDFVAQSWDVEEILAELDERNLASLALAKKLGFLEFARVIDADHFKGASSTERHLIKQIAPQLQTTVLVSRTH